MKNHFLKVVFALLILIIGLTAFTKRPSGQKATVYVFLSETCPICQSYTLTLKDLYKKYNAKGVTFVGVFPNYYADQDSISYFKKHYSIPFELMIDKNSELTKRFSASITPEVFVVDVQGQVLYSGRIDDCFYALGKRRKVISSKDLEYALEAITKNEKIKASKTEAVGCIISISK